MYGGRHVFKGRITGFTMGTGSTLALLPPQNATGNFVKIVQRLPVRIELSDYDPDKAPLFIGISVVPYVYINEPPTGPDAGKFLQAYRAAVAEPLVRPPARRAPANDRRWRCHRTAAIPRGGQPLARRRRRRGADVHGGARHHDRGVALRYIAGGLSATVDDGEWVITSYLAANAIILPITGWLSRISAAATTSCCRSPSSPSPRGCAAWPPASSS